MQGEAEATKVRGFGAKGSNFREGLCFAGVTLVLEGVYDQAEV